MAVVSPTDAVLALVRSASHRVVIAAPYIKSATIRRLLRTLPKTVSELVCITRWQPEDIVSGACDLDIMDDVTQIQGGRLMVHHHLHAKYYANGKESLVGSANLTARGLGWYTPGNVEILVALPADFPGLADWESTLLDSAVEATEELREQIRAQAKQIEEAGPIYHLSEVEGDSGDGNEVSLWIPQCPVPERLWEVYRGRGADTMVSSAFKAAQDDLVALAPPRGLSEDLFTAYVTGILRQMPLLTEIDKLASTGLADTKAHEFLSDQLVDYAEETSEFGRIWRVVKLWLVHFFPDSYRLETGQEVLVRGRQIPRR